MSVCRSNCSLPVPQSPYSDCSFDSRNGGIAMLLFFSCDVEFRNIYDIQEWCNYIKEGKLIGTLEVLGQKPRASAIKKRASSCKGEQVIGFEYTVTFQDYNADNDEFSDYDFWNALQAHQRAYQVGFITCDGYLHGFIPVARGSVAGNFITNHTLEVSNVIEDDVNGSSYWDGTITWKGASEIRPIKVQALLSALRSNCNTLDIYSCTPAFSITFSYLHIIDNTPEYIYKYFYVVTRNSCCAEDILLSGVPNNVVGTPLDYVTVNRPFSLPLSTTTFAIDFYVNTAHPSYNLGDTLSLPLVFDGGVCGVQTLNISLEMNNVALACFELPDYSNFMLTVEAVIRTIGAIDLNLAKNVNFWVNLFNTFDYTGYPHEIRFDPTTYHIILDGIKYRQRLKYLRHENYTSPDRIGYYLQIYDNTCIASTGIGVVYNNNSGLLDGALSAKACLLALPSYDEPANLLNCYRPLQFDCSMSASILALLAAELDALWASNPNSFQPILWDVSNPLVLEANALYYIQQLSFIFPTSLFALHYGTLNYVYYNGYFTGYVYRIKNYTIHAPDHASVTFLFESIENLYPEYVGCGGNFLEYGIRFRTNINPTWITPAIDYLGCINRNILDTGTEFRCIN